MDSDGKEDFVFMTNGTTHTRPTISLLSVITFVLGLALGVTGTTYHFVTSHRPIPAPWQSVAQCSGNLARIAMGLEAYKARYGAYPTSQYVIVPEYLVELPTCPATRRMTYRTSFGPELVADATQPDDYFLIECCGANHGAALVNPYNPRFDSLRGLVVENGL